MRVGGVGRLVLTATLLTPPLLLVPPPPRVEANNYLVSKELGSDMNPCAGAIEDTNPDYDTELLATPTAALACAVANPDLNPSHGGDRITLLAYRDGTIAYYSDVLDSAVITFPTGTNVTPVTIMAEQGHYQRVVLRPPDGSSAFAVRTGTKPYIVLRNLVLDGSLQTGTTPICVLSGGATNITFYHIEFKNSPAQGCTDTGAGGSNTYQLSTFHNNVGDGLKVSTASNTITTNTFYSNGGDGLDTSGANTSDTNTIERNRSYSNTGYGFVIGDNAGGNSNIARNNLSYLNGHGVQIQGTSNDWSNNVSYNNTGTGIKVDAGATNSLIKNNIAYLNGTNITDSGTTSTLTTNQTSNPSFNDAAGGDFTLADASTARNAGTTIATVTKDFRKYPRPQGSAYDIGAYEMPDGCPAGVCTLSAGGDFQAALYQVKCGETIKLTDGDDFSSGLIYLVPSKNPCTTPTTITRTGTLPAIYDVLTNCYVKGPNFAAEMVVRDACKAAMITAYETGAPTLTTTTAMSISGQGGLLAFEPDADYWSIVGVHLRSTNTHATDGELPTFTLITLGTEPALNTSVTDSSMLPDHITIDRTSMSSPIGLLYHAIFGESSNLTLKNSLCHGAKNATNEQDAQCLFAVQSPGPFTIYNNYLEASGENVVFGGGGAVFWGMIPSDITVYNNYMTKDWTWWRLASRAGYVWGGTDYTVKNVFECKNCQRLQLYNNVLEAAWYVDVGDLVLFQAVSNGAGAFWYTVKDLEIWGNVIRHGGQGISIAGKGGNNGGATEGSNINIHDNLIYDVTKDYPFNVAYAHSAGDCFRLYSNSSTGFVHTPLDGITINHNTCDNTDGNYALAGAVAADRFTNFTLTNNLGRGNANFDVLFSFASGTGGTTGFDTMMPASYTVTNNAFATSSNQSTWPANTWFERVVGDDAATLVLWKAIFTNYATGDYSVAVGSPYKALGIRDATDNKDLGADMSLLPLGGGSPASPTIHIRWPRFHARNELGEPDRETRQRDRRTGEIGPHPAIHQLGAQRTFAGWTPVATSRDLRTTPRTADHHRTPFGEHRLARIAFAPEAKYARAQQQPRPRFRIGDQAGRLLRGEVIARTDEGRPVVIDRLKREGGEAAADQIAPRRVLIARELEGDREHRREARIGHLKWGREKGPGPVPFRHRRDAREWFPGPTGTGLQREHADPDVIRPHRDVETVSMQIRDGALTGQGDVGRPWLDSDRIRQHRTRPPQYDEQQDDAHGVEVRTNYTDAFSANVLAELACQTNTDAQFRDFCQTNGAA